MFIAECSGTHTTAPQSKTSASSGHHPSPGDASVERLLHDAVIEAERDARLAMHSFEQDKNIQQQLARLRQQSLLQ
jgi:hypothetical protein